VSGPAPAPLAGVGPRRPGPRRPLQPTVDGAGAWTDRRAAYRSAEVWAAEQRLIFRRSWQVVATVDDVAEDGSFVTATPGGEPVVVVRDGTTVRALSNVCRHRAMRLCEGVGTARALRCAYHGWRYGLDGSLQAVPQRAAQFPDLDPDRLALESFAVRCWAGLVLVRLDHPSPQDAPEPFSRLDAALAHHREAELPVVARQRLAVRCNWKLLVENHVDAYHLWYLHEESLADFDHRRFSPRWWPDGTWMSEEPCRTAPVERPGLRLVPGAPATIGAHLLFPGLLVATSPWWLATYWVEPGGAERTDLHVVVRGALGSDPTALMADVRRFIDEDVWACEAVQDGLSACAVDEGPLAADHEAHVAAFRALVGKVLDGRA
jgi:choline monooxygenase